MRTRGLWYAVGSLPLVVALLQPALLAAHKKPQTGIPGPPDLLLEGGRKLSFERVLSSERDIQGKPGFWKKLVNVVAGEPDYKRMVRPYGVAVDSHGRVIVTDPGMGGVHVFDTEQHKYKFLERKEKSKDTMLQPQCVALDANDNIYVTDSQVGKIFVFEASGKYKGVFGSLKGGEGYFKRPTGIAIDRETHEIYVTDTLRDRVYILDSNGQVLKSFGQHGEKNGEFNLPTELMIGSGVIAVVDAMNFRIQTFDRKGNFQSAFGNMGDADDALFRPKGIGLDSENHIYLVEGLSGTVRVFDREGQLLYFFGRRGKGLGEFQLPAGIFIDQNDKVYVVDSYNRRVQVFRYRGLKLNAQGTKP
ncbi:MAG TPA: 6-bladed beta-propeller [Terriglobales bacterium]|nr:6-bladed beta-propeller [Terriglobales bacterium]